MDQRDYLLAISIKELKESKLESTFSDIGWLTWYRGYIDP